MLEPMPISEILIIAWLALVFKEWVVIQYARAKRK
jgi:hypothetical protein